MELTKELVCSLLDYDMETGLFTWKKSKYCKDSGIAGWKNKDGRIYINIKSKLYLAHRLAFLIVEGNLPKNVVDHIDGNPSNNSWNNLRHATQQQNVCNSRTRSDNILGVKGVEMLPNGKYRAGITRNGKRKHLGVFESIEMAHSAYMNAATEIHGCFANGGANASH